MKNRIKHILYLPLLIAFALTTNAQERHEVSVHAAGGLSTLNSKMAPIFNIENKHKMGATIGAGYTHNFSELFALQSGVEFAFYNSEYNMENIDGNYVTSLGEDRVLFSYELNKYKEKAKTTWIQIPLMARFTFPIGTSLKFHAAGGTKIGINIHGKYKNSYDLLRTTGVYVEDGKILDMEPLTDNPELGFGTFTDGKNRGDIDLKVMYTASVETGVSYMINERYSVFGGAYFDYSLNNIRKNNRDYFIQHSNQQPEQILNNGMLNSVNKRYLEAMPMAKRIHPLAVGLKLKVSYHF